MWAVVGFRRVSGVTFLSIKDNLFPVNLVEDLLVHFLPTAIDTFLLLLFGQWGKKLTTAINSVKKK